MYVNLAFWLAVIYILHVPSTFLKSRRQLALGSDPWEHLDDDLYLIRRGLYQPPASQPARANLASLSSQFSQCI